MSEQVNQNLFLDNTPNASAVGKAGLAGKFSLRMIWHRLEMVIHHWHRNHATRRHLCSLPGYLLRDIGMTCEELQAELKKPFWRD